MVWAYEVIPLFARLGVGLIPSDKDSLLPIPRMLQYHLKRAAKWDYDTLESLLKSSEVVVHPFLIPTKREMREEFILSFDEHEDASDENIDQLKKTLEGVTKLTNPIISSDEGSSGIKNAINPLAITPLEVPFFPPEFGGEMKSTPSPPPPPPPPPSSAPDSQIVWLLKMLNQKVDLAVGELSKKVDLAVGELGELSKRVDLAVGELGELSKRVDLAVGELGELSKKVDLAVGDKLGKEEELEKKDDFVQQNFEDRPERERKRSHYFTSPYTAEGAFKKPKIDDKKVSQPPGIFLSISEEKKESFYCWYNREDSSKWAKGFNGEYDHNFFNQILDLGVWFEDSHPQEGLSVLRNRQSRFPQIYDQQCAVLDAYFQQVLDGEIDRLSTLMPNNPVKKSKKYVKPAHSLSMVELEKFLLESPYNSTFDEYFEGRRPLDGRHWRDVRKVYGILNIANMHWISIVWFLDEGRIELLDCNRACYKKDVLEITMWGPSVLFPKLLKASCQFLHLNLEIFDRQWKYTFVDNLPSNSNGGDCGIYSLEFVEFHMTKTPLHLLNDSKIPFFQETLAIEIFQEEM